MDTFVDQRKGLCAAIRSALPSDLPKNDVGQE